MDIKEELKNLKQTLDDLRRRWPAHSVKPEMINEMEALEEAIAKLEELMGRTVREVGQEVV